MNQTLVRILAERGCFVPGSYRGFKAVCPTCHKVNTQDMVEEWKDTLHDTRYIEMRELCEHFRQVYSDNFDNSWMQFAAQEK